MFQPGRENVHIACFGDKRMVCYRFPCSVSVDKIYSSRSSRSSFIGFIFLDEFVRHIQKNNKRQSIRVIVWWVKISSAFEIYSDALRKWTGSKDDDFNEKYQRNVLWANFQRPGDFNPPHDHADTLSFVIFLDVPDKLIEENKAYKGRSAGPGGINFVYGDGTREAVTHHSFVPKAGDMYIFPAWLKHWVYPFKSDCTRISVSGNVANSIKIKNLKVDKPV